ncbi:MAG TPA: BadF/BadG/BcrA/BcrD ATPase family protein [Candidatus Cybelea sp.]|nr:BadF/BadG/BcrA/BcrD ATPase family protein [Candidatus Cybelea sp.]
MSLLFAGIDGGQSSTVALIADDLGRILSRGVAGPADEVAAGAGSTRLANALRDALADACRNAGLRGESDFAAIVAGISGYEGRIYGKKPELPTERLVVMHDAPVAHAGALAGAPGVVVIAGTGSVVYAIDDHGESRTIGGWGYLFGDEGSAFSIARDVLALLMAAQDDGDGSFSEEARAACDFFAMNSLRRVARAFYAGALTRDRLAAFTPVAIRFARFRPIADSGADRLAVLARRALNEVNERRAALTGGLFADAGFYERVRRGILNVVPGAQVGHAKYEPAGGALLLAYQEVGLPVKELRL